MTQSDREVIWEPQPGPQTALITCPVAEVFFGGARGGGKTEGSLGDWLEHSQTYGEAATGVFFRRTFKQLEEVVARTAQIFPRLGAKYNVQKAEWLMPGGGRLKFRYLEKDSDAEEYQGHSYTRVYIEEATNFPSPSPINKLRATLRSAKGVPCGLRLTGNPGGPGHGWVKKRYIDPNPKGYQILKETFKLPDGTTREIERVFIPSRITDNPLLMKNDPDYILRLYQSGSPQLVKAWLEGDWSIIDGAFFDQWDPDIHVLPFDTWMPRIPAHSYRFLSIDWGYGKPFDVGWYAVSDGKWGLPREALVKYREWYGWNGQPNTGLRLEPKDLLAGILARTKEPLNVGVCDPSMFIRDGGPAIAETLILGGLDLRKADNKRIPGWAEMRNRLATVDYMPDGTKKPRRPLLYYLDRTCDDGSIRTIPSLQHDENNVEDLDTEGEDHAADTDRYACMSRPWVEDAPVEEDDSVVLPKTLYQYTINELIERQQARTRLRESM